MASESILFLMVLFGGFAFIFAIVGAIVINLLDWHTKRSIKKTIEQLANNTTEISPEEFMNMRTTKLLRGKGYYASNHNFEGVYILRNVDKDMYYVGQAKRVLDRVNQHFTGKGNGDVYADWKYGDDFTIKMIALENTEFESLNDLERHTIEYYNSYSKGYNKNRGNMYGK